MKIRKTMLAAFTFCAVLAPLYLLSGASIQAGSDKPYVEKGHKLFKQYCASCHGLDAKGGGAVAASLKATPADLTMIQKKGEKFPINQVLVAIDGEKTARAIEAHGDSQMPVWGTVFRRTGGLQKDNYVYALAKYIESIQAAGK
ncbi:MAG: c-type cytochrome [Acidobacteria bacterium]|nr:c-type cytochrome [Acidobacteriota bacterium]